MALTKVSGTGLKDDCITSAHIGAVITNADIASNAAIDLSKLGTSGTASSSNFLRGDGAWAAAGVSDGDKGDITVSSSGASWTIDADAVTYAKMQNATSGRLLGRTSSNTGVIEELTKANILSFLNVEDGAQPTPNNAYFKTAYEANSDTNAFTDADHAKLDGIDLTALSASNLTSGTVAAARLDTATTQSAGNNSTKIATTAYADTAVSNLVDSAPGTLNTLNELAAALGDDANFSTTVTNSIATKLPLAGGTLTGNVKLNDSIKTIFGSDDDAYMMHNGSHQYNRCSTGYYHIQAQEIRFNKADGNETLLKAISDGAVELYFDSTKKLETTSYGGYLSGEWRINDDFVINADNKNIKIGQHSDTLIYHNSSDQCTYIDNYTNDLVLRTSGSTRKNLVLKSAAGTEIYYDNDKKAESVSGGFTVTGTCTATAFAGDGSSLTNVSASDATKMPLAGGTFTNNVTFNDSVYSFFGSDSDGYLMHNGSAMYLQNSTSTGELFIRSAGGTSLTNGDGSERFAQFYNGVAYINHSGSTKLQTSSTGVTVTGTCTATAFAGDGSNLTGIAPSSLSASGEVDITSSGGAVDINAAHGVTIDSGYWTKITPSYYFQVDSSQKIELNAGYGFLATGGASTGYPFKTQFQQYELYHNNGTDRMGLWSYIGGNTALGYKALQDISSVHSGKNTALGYEAGKAITSGVENVVIGNNCGSKIEGGNNNVTIGSDCAENLVSGADNTVIGSYAFADGTGARNTATGRNALRYATGNDNVGIGYQAGFGTSGSASGKDNVAIGKQSLLAFTSGEENVAIGTGAGHDMTSGKKNVYIGFNAGNGATDGDSNIIIGHEATPSAAGVSGEVTIGDANISKFRIPGINFELADNGGTPTNGHVLTMASGGATWQAVSANDSTKLPLAGGSMTGNLTLNDNKKIRFGNDGDATCEYNTGSDRIDIYLSKDVLVDYAVSNSAGTVKMNRDVLFGDHTSSYYKRCMFGNSNDLQIYHNGTNSKIVNNTGQLQVCSDNLRFLNSASGEVLAEFVADQGAKLYYNDGKRFETTTDGAIVGGGTYVSELYFKTVNGADQRGRIQCTNGNEVIFFNGTNERIWDYDNNGEMGLYYDNSKKLATTSSGVSITGDLSVSGSVGGAGKILQVITTTITGQQSGTNNSDSSENTTDLTGFSLNITPSSTSSKILLMASISQSSTNWSFCVHAYRDSTIIAQGDALGGNRTQYTWLCANARDYNDANTATTFHIIDSPSSTSQITYKLKGCTRGTNSTWNINKAARHGQYNTGWIQSCVSTFTLMEIG